MIPEARTLDQRIQDTRQRLANDVDVWVATADPATATPYLMPLSFLWDGEHIIVSTADTNPTARYLRAVGEARLALGHTRDVVLIEATVDRIVPTAELPQELGDTFAERTGFDPRKQTKTPYPYFFLRPRQIQAWREANEIANRTILRNGTWRS